MPFFTLDKEKCKKDSICARHCVAGIIQIDKETNYPYIEERRADRCIKCGQCVAFCPHDACNVESLDKDKYLTVDPKEFPTVIQTDTLITTRRSIRLFSKKLVNQEVMQDIINIAQRGAPTAKNSQLVSWYATKDFKSTETVAELVCEFSEKSAKENPNSPESPFDRALAKRYRAGFDIIARNAPHLIFTTVPKSHDMPEDGTVAITYFELSAHARRLGTCWAGYVLRAIRHYQPLREYLGISEDEYVTASLMVGYPIYGLAKKVPPRKPAILKWK